MVNISQNKSQTDLTCEVPIAQKDEDLNLDSFIHSVLDDNKGYFYMPIIEAQLVQYSLNGELIT
jgi:hypothetical protein